MKARSTPHSTWRDDRSCACVPACRPVGFALVSVLAILVLLMVLVLAITSVIHVETRTSSSGRDLLLARQNALLGLDIAIGQLQDYAGKDQAVTFPATTYYPTKDVTTGTGPLFDDATFGYRAKAVTAKTTGNSPLTSTYLTPSERSQWDNALKDWWNNNNAPRNPRWTGIMDASLRVDRASGSGATSANATLLAAQRYEDNPATKFGEPKRDQLPVWLVSGNEKFTINQETGVVTDQSGAVVSPNAQGRYPGYYTPDVDITTQVASDPNLSIPPGKTAADYIVTLVGEGSAAVSSNSTDGLDGRVKVKKQEVRAHAPGGNSTLTGHYAYWVGDEATKANFAARDRTDTTSYPADPSSQTAYPNDISNKSSKEYRNRLQVPQRIGWENISITGNATSGNATTRFQDVATFSPNDPYLENISTSKEIGLLQAATDPSSAGATKTQQVKDAAKNNFHSLTAFSKSLLTDTALGGLKKDLTVFLEGSSPAGLGNQTIMDPSRYLPNDPRLGGNNTGFPAMPTDPKDAKLPLWSDVKTWHGAMGVGGGEVPVTKGMAPVFANFQIFFAITHDADKLQFHMIPMIALWNPYDATLASTEYTLQWRHNFSMNYFGIAVKNSDCPDSSGAAGTKIIIPRPSPSPPEIYFMGPYTMPGWFTAANKYSRTFPYWHDTVPHWNCNFAPFDKNATTGATGVNLPTPDDPSATWVNYRFTARFAPGEVKVFTVDSANCPSNIDPNSLHNGATVIPLTNNFDKDRPASYYFEFATGLQKAPGILTTDADEVRWCGLGGTGPLVGSSLRLLSGVMPNATPLWTNYYSGAPMSNNGGNQNFPNANMNIPRDPSKWWKAYPLNAWPGTFDGTTDTIFNNAGGNNLPIIGFGRSSMNPFLTSPTEIFSGANYIANATCFYYRAFAVFNPFASEGIDLPRELDYARMVLTFGGNNMDRHFTLRPLVGDQTNMRWNNNNTCDMNAPASTFGNNGYAGIHWQKSDAFNNQGLPVLPIRLVRPAQINTVSLGQLQQVNMARYFWQPSFVLGNSEASPYVDRSKAAGLQKSPVATSNSPNSMIWPQTPPASFLATHPNNSKNEYIDLSYLVNENVWDSYFLSTIPQSGTIPQDMLDNSTPLNNGRHRFRADVTPTDAEARDWLTSGAFLENHGALNVNSTSVEAWKSLFTAFRRLSITGAGTSNPNNTVPISRTLSPLRGPIALTESSSTRVPADYGANASGLRNYEKALGGFRYLSDAQIQTLAERVVDEIRLRGPFLSLADFINRRLVSPNGADDSSSAWYRARTFNSANADGGGSAVARIASSYDPVVGMSGINGGMQRAINLSGINGGMNDPAPDPDNRVFGVIPGLTAASTARPMQIFSNYAFYLDSEHLAGAPAGEVGQLLSHSPGFVTQADLLAMVGPALTPRGDTFMIRTYGDCVDKNGKVLSRAYIEAIVQRVADPVTPAGTSGAEKWRYTDKFGRKQSRFI